MKKEIIENIRTLLLKHRNETLSLHACESTPPMTTRYCRSLGYTDTYTFNNVTLNDADEVLVDSHSAFETKTDKAEDLSEDYLKRIRRFLQKNEEFIWIKESPSTEEAITVTLSATQQRYLCELLCKEIDSAKEDRAEEVRMMDNDGAAIIQAHIEFLEEMLATLKV